jgi:excisionase family DNA binding protein
MAMRKSSKPPKSSKSSKPKAKPAPQRVPLHPDHSAPLAVSVARACELSSLGQTKIYELIGNGEIETITIGRKRLVIYASLEKFVEKRRALR